MEKNENLGNEKKKKLPFNVFSKKGLMALAVAGVIVAGPIMLAGCSNGKDGTDGTKWESGLSYTEFTDAKVGDFFIDTDDYILYKKTATDWEIVMRDYGRPGNSSNEVELQVDSNNIQWRYKTGSDTNWKNLIDINTLKGANGGNGYTPYIQDGYWYINGINQNVPATGNSGKEIEIQNDGTAIQWRYVGDADWTEIVELSFLKGETGNTGANGKSVEIAINNGNIQWKYTDNSNEWQTIIAVDDLKGSDGTNGTTPHIDSVSGNWFIGEQNTGVKAGGVDGREITLQATADYIQWKYEGDSVWNNLIPLSSLKGADGKDGATWLEGTTAPTNEGKDGDFYLNTTTYDIYKNTNGTWNQIGNIKGQNGTNGTNGATWLTGTAVSGTGTEISATVENAKVGDLYFNTSTCDIYTCTAENTWKWLSNIKGEQGDKGQDGTSVYVGYDGYIWNGADRTDFKMSDTIVDEYCAVNTLGLVNHSKYFGSYDINTSATQVALMDNYFETIGKTGLSGTIVTEMSLYASKAGQVTIGTAKVADVLANRETGTKITLSNATTKTLAIGVNKVADLSIQVGDDETLVIGDANTDTASLVAYQGLEVNDEQGTFATITSGTAQDSANMYAETNGVKDKVVLNVQMEGTAYDYQSIFGDDLSAVSVSGMMAVQANLCPFGYAYDYSGKTITKIKVPIKTLTDYTQDQAITILVYKGISNGVAWTSDTSYQLVIPANTYKSNTVNDWYEFTTINGEPMNIVLGDDEGIGFGASTDPVSWGYLTSFSNSNRKLADLKNGSVVYSNGAYLLFDLYENVQVSGASFKEHLETLTQEEQTAAIEQKNFNEFKTTMAGKNISILGDSISTYEGYSNDATNTNSTIGGNYVSYGPNSDLKALSSADETWWMQVINQLNMNLCVNNSSGGSKVFGTGSNNIPSAYIDRCMQLHDDTTDNNENNENNEIINPDYIMVYLGVNDATQKVTPGSYDDINWETLIVDNGDGTYTYGTPTNFAEAYAVMIHKMVHKYPNAKIFIFNLGKDFGGDGNQDNYNNTIAKVAEKYGCYLADMTASVMSGTNYTNYSSDWAHPTEAGMDVMTEVMIKVMYEAYLQSKNS